MPTIGATVQNAIMRAQTSRKFGTQKASLNRSLLGASGSRSLLNTDSSKNARTDYVKAMMEDQTGLANKVRDYNEEKSSFQSTFNDKISSLKKSNQALKTLNAGKSGSGNSANSAAQANKSANNAMSSVSAQKKQNSQPTMQELAEKAAKTRQDEENKREAQREAERIRNRMDDEQIFIREPERNNEEAAQQVNAAADNFNSIRGRILGNSSDAIDRGASGLDTDVKEDLAAIQGFVQDFNSTMSYLNEGRDLSNRLSTVASSFGDSGSFENSLNRIGISVGSDGGLSVDTARLAKTLTENPSSVDAALGSNGLAGQLDRKVDMVSRQADQMFPPIKDFLGGKSAEDTKAMYAGNSTIAANAYTDVGSLFHKVG